MRWPEAIVERNANRRRRALSRAVWELSVECRRAVLVALEDQELIAGAYTDRHGRVCPMLAAFRHGARSGVGSFPGAWDRFTQARRPRAATPREREILRALLEESLAPPLEPTSQPRPVEQPVRVRT
jgi:hypothetical protein